MMNGGGSVSERVGRGAWLMLVILIFLYMLNAFDRTVLSLMVGHVKADMHVTDGQIGLMLGLAFALFYGVFGIPIGMLVDRFSRRLILCCGVALWSAATIACGFATTFPLLLAARMALGIGEAALMPAAHVLMAETFPKARLSTAMSIYYLGGVFGNSLSVALGGAMIAHYGQFDFINLDPFGQVRGWQMPFVLVGALGVVSAGLVYVFREPDRRIDENAAGAERVSLWAVVRRRKGVLLCVLGTVVLYALVLYSTVLWTPTYMARAFGWNSQRIGASYSVVHLLGTGIGTVAAGFIVDRLFSRGVRDAHLRVFLLCVLIGGACGVAAFQTADPYVFLVLLGFLHLFGFAFSGYAAALVQAISPHAVRGRMAAMYVLASIIIGSGLGPWIIGLLTQHVFGEARLGSAIALVIGVASVIAVASAAAGLRYMREAVALTDSETE